MTPRFTDRICGLIDHLVSHVEKQKSEEGIHATRKLIKAVKALVLCVQKDFYRPRSPGSQESLFQCDKRQGGCRSPASCYHRTC